MLNLLLVGCGGFIGSVLRYLTGHLVHALLRHATFPYGTLAANVLGCFFIGLLGGIASQHTELSSATRLFLFTGVLGGFTTFSTFSFDTFSMLQAGGPQAVLLAMVHILSHLFLGLLAVYFGHYISHT